MNISGLRVGRRHGLSGKEKKNTSDNLNSELHLELADSRNIEAVLILFPLSELRSVEPTIDKDNEFKFETFDRDLRVVAEY